MPNEYIDANKLIADYMDTTAATEYVTKYEADYMAENEKISHSSSMIFHTKMGNARNGAFPIFDQYSQKSMLL